MILSLEAIAIITAIVLAFLAYQKARYNQLQSRNRRLLQRNKALADENLELATECRLAGYSLEQARFENMDLESSLRIREARIRDNDEQFATICEVNRQLEDERDAALKERDEANDHAQACDAELLRSREFIFRDGQVIAVPLRNRG